MENEPLLRLERGLVVLEDILQRLLRLRQAQKLAQPLGLLLDHLAPSLAPPLAY